VVPAALALALLASCSRSTGKLSPELTQRFESEGIVRRADDTFMRYTHGTGTARSGWEEWPASIVVTHRSVYLHQNDRVRLEITPRSTGEYSVRRDHDRLSIHAGSGNSVRSWSFHPPDDAPGWAEDIRAVIRGAAGAQPS
jgi:hypothetical protein